jgi:hypothetical protein
MASHIERRKFLATVGGAAVWPFAARAQHPGKLPTIGFLGTTDPSTMRPWITAFVERLREVDHTEAKLCVNLMRWRLLQIWYWFPGRRHLRRYYSWSPYWNSYGNLYYEYLDETPTD